MIRWIASYPKSGSTWVRLFLMAYQQREKFDMNVRLYGHYRDTNPAFHEKVSPLPLDQLTPAEALALRPAALVHMAHQKPRRPFVKTHAANLTVNDEIRMIPPSLTESALYLLRDPRDIAGSYAHHRGSDVDTTIEFMQNPRALRTTNGIPIFISDWSRHVRSFRKTSFPCLTVRYEDLHAEPVETFGTILEFFRIDPDAARLEQAVAATDFDVLKAREEADGYIGWPTREQSFFRRGNAGAWVDELTPGQVAKIEAAHGTEMELAGYALSVSAATVEGATGNGEFRRVKT